MADWGGNGNGFKLGGANSHGRHTVRNCIAFDNNYGQKGQKGFDENDNRDKIVLTDCIAFNNIKIITSPSPRPIPGCLFSPTTSVSVVSLETI